MDDLDSYKKLAESVGYMLFSFGYRSDMRPLYSHSPMTVNAVYTALKECGHDIDGDSHKKGELPLNWLSDAVELALNEQR